MTEFEPPAHSFPGAPAGSFDLGLLVAGVLELPALLAQVAAFAVRAVPGADGAGVTVLHRAGGEGRVEAIAASSEFIREIDTLQYDVLNEGPCITAARERRTVRSGSLGGATLWPHFGPRVGRRGVHSALSLPLLLSGEAGPTGPANPAGPADQADQADQADEAGPTDPAGPADPADPAGRVGRVGKVGQVVGTINLYARARNGFDDRAVEVGESFARPAAVAVHNAQVMAHMRVLTAQLQQALASRPVVDQAVGLIRGRSGVSADEAFARLKAISQNEHTKLVVVAQRIVDEASRRAQSRAQFRRGSA